MADRITTLDCQSLPKLLATAQALADFWSEPVLVLLVADGNRDACPRQAYATLASGADAFERKHRYVELVPAGRRG